MHAYSCIFECSEHRVQLLAGNTGAKYVELPALEFSRSRNGGSPYDACKRAADTDPTYAEVGELREGPARSHHHDIEGFGCDRFHQLCDIAPLPHAGSIETIRTGIRKR